MSYQKKTFLKATSLLFALALLALPTLALTLTNQTLQTSNTNYKLFINQSLGMEWLFINSTTIELYNISTSGRIDNTGSTAAIINFHNMTDPNNDLTVSTGTVIENLLDDTYTLQAGQYILIGAASQPTPTDGGGGGPGNPGTGGFCPPGYEYNADHTRCILTPTPTIPGVQPPSDNPFDVLHQPLSQTIDEILETIKTTPDTAAQNWKRLTILVVVLAAAILVIIEIRKQRRKRKE